MHTPIRQVQQRTKPVRKVIPVEPEVIKKTNKPVKRGYLPVGTNRLYDKLVDRALLFSSILNIEARQQDKDLAFVNFTSQREVNNLVLEYRGQVANIQDELYKKREGDKIDQLVGQQVLWEEYKSQKIREGHDPKNIEEPSTFFEKRINLESRLYVCEKELEFLEKTLANCTEQIKKIDTANVLRNGVKGCGTLLDGSLAFLDFQPVKKSKDGTLTIYCEVSPYHGVASYDYINKIVKPASQLRNKILKAKADLTKKLYESGVESTGIKFETIKLEKTFFERYPEQEIKTIQFRGRTMPDPSGITKHEFNSEEK